MGKVYDALRRAEEQRARRIQETVGSAAPAAPPEEPARRPVASPRADAFAPPSPPRPASERRRRGLLERLGLGRRRSHGSSRDAGALNKRRIALLQPESFVAEQFRSLRARIDALAVQHPLHAIGVTSAVPGDGKSMAAIGLAVVSSMQVGRRVLLVDCDLRQPAVHHSLGLRPEAGLAEVLRGEAKIEEAVLRAEGTQLDVLPVRSLPPNPSELLGSPRMRELLEALAGRYDRVILDLPPALGLPDAKVVSGLCDGVVLVVRSGVTEAADVEGAVDVLGRERLIGTVLNGAEIETSRYGYGR